MNAKEAIRAAKSYVKDIYEGEGIINLGLEELRFKELDRSWEITLGFSRPWIAGGPAVSAIGGLMNPKRTYKIVVIKDDSGEIVELRNREVEEAG